MGNTARKKQKTLRLDKNIENWNICYYEKHSKNIDSSWSSKIEKDNAIQILSPPQAGIIILMSDKGGF